MDIININCNFIPINYKFNFVTYHNFEDHLNKKACYFDRTIFQNFIVIVVMFGLINFIHCLSYVIILIFIVEL